MIHRITYRFREHFGKTQKLCVIVRAPGYFFLGHPVRTHKPPFVMIAAEPDLSYIVKLPVLINLARIYMTVIIYYRHTRGVIKIEFFRRFVFKHEGIVYYSHFRFSDYQISTTSPVFLERSAAKTIL